jgi:hypothetical protein
MGRTIAEALRDEGMQKGVVNGKQQTILYIFRRMFGRKLPAAITAVIARTSDLATLDAWLGNVLDAHTLDEVGIPRRS